MIIKIVGFIIFLIIALLGYVFYAEYKDNILFRGESFKESYGIRVILDFIIPKDTHVIDNRLFYVFGETTVRDFYMTKLLCFLCSIVVSVSVVVTNYYNNRLDVFSGTKDLPYVINEHEYNILVKDLTFNTIDEHSDMINLKRNIKNSSEHSRYVLTDSELLYKTLRNMTSDLQSCFGIMEVISGLLVLLLGWFIPNIILSVLFKLLKADMSFEYAKLESYIYLNRDERVETILMGLANESLVYRELFKAFLLRYREDRFLSYSLILGNSGFTQEFKTLIEYLSLLENGTSEAVKNKIIINRKSYMDKLKMEIRKSAQSKKDALNAACIFSIVIGIVGVLVNIISSLL